MLIPLLAVAATLVQPQGDLGVARRFPAQGFSIATPGPTWIVQDGAETPSGFRVNVALRDAGGLVAASVMTLPVPEGSQAASLLDKSIAGLPAHEEYLEHQVLPDALFDGQTAPGIRVEWQAVTTGRISIVQRYLVAEDRAYLLQAHAPLKEWDEHWPDLEACMRSFRLVEPTTADHAAMALPRLAARCGSEAAWAADWDDAMRRAKATGRHALVVVRSYPGFDIPDSTAISTFMDEDVLALVRTRLIPLRLETGAPAPIRGPESYGMSPSTFGVALLLVDADGHVLADTPHVDPDACLPWLRAQLERHPEPAPIPEVEDPLAQAKLHLDRGELKLAHKVLDSVPAEARSQDRARAWMLYARLHRLRHQGIEALSALGIARAAWPDGAATIDCERALVLLREGQPEKARQLLEDSIERDGAAVLPKAIFLLATIVQFLDGVDAAHPWWVRLTNEHPDSRWAWAAAVRLENEDLLKAVKSRGSFEWPRPEVLAFLDEPAAAPTDAAHGEKAAPEALRWLMTHQREDGSWPSSTDLRQAADLPPGAIGAAIDALAARALMQRQDDHADAARSGIAFLLQADERRRALDLPAVYMDYTAWASWAQLELIADALTENPDNEGPLRAFGARLVTDLQERVRGNGGWSYYLSGNADGSAAVEQSISFTTAAAVIGGDRCS